MLASQSLILILSLSGGGRVTGESWSKAGNESGISGIFLENVEELNDRGRESRLISTITEHLQACTKSS